MRSPTAGLALVFLVTLVESIRGACVTDYYAKNINADDAAQIAVYFKALEIRSIFDCAQFCSQRTFCKSAIYNTAERSCSISYSHTTDCRKTQDRFLDDFTSQGIALISCTKDCSQAKYIARRPQIVTDQGSYETPRRSVHIITGEPHDGPLRAPRFRDAFPHLTGMSDIIPNTSHGGKDSISPDDNSGSGEMGVLNHLIIENITDAFSVEPQDDVFVRPDGVQAPRNICYTTIQDRYLLGATYQVHSGISISDCRCLCAASWKTSTMKSCVSLHYDRMAQVCSLNKGTHKGKFDLIEQKHTVYQFVTCDIGLLMKVAGKVCRKDEQGVTSTKTGNTTETSYTTPVTTTVDQGITESSGEGFVSSTTSTERSSVSASASFVTADPSLLTSSESVESTSEPSPEPTMAAKTTPDASTITVFEHSSDSDSEEIEMITRELNHLLKKVHREEMAEKMTKQQKAQMRQRIIAQRKLKQQRQIRQRLHRKQKQAKKPSWANRNNKWSVARMLQAQKQRNKLQQQKQKAKSQVLKRQHRNESGEDEKEKTQETTTAPSNTTANSSSSTAKTTPTVASTTSKNSSTEKSSEPLKVSERTTQKVEATTATESSTMTTTSGKQTTSESSTTVTKEPELSTPLTERTTTAEVPTTTDISSSQEGCFEVSSGYLMTGSAGGIERDVSTIQECMCLCANNQVAGHKFECVSATFYHNDGDCVLNYESRYSKPKLFVKARSSTYNTTYMGRTCSIADSIAIHVTEGLDMGCRHPPTTTAPPTTTTRTPTTRKPVNSDMCFIELSDHVLEGIALAVEASVSPQQCKCYCAHAEKRYGDSCLSAQYYYDSKTCLINKQNRYSNPENFNAVFGGQVQSYFEFTCATQDFVHQSYLADDCANILPVSEIVAEEPQKPLDDHDKNESKKVDDSTEIKEEERKSNHSKGEMKGHGKVWKAGKSDHNKEAIAKKTRAHTTTTPQPASTTTKFIQQERAINRRIPETEGLDSAEFFEGPTQEDYNEDEEPLKQVPKVQDDNKNDITEEETGDLSEEHEEEDTSPLYETSESIEQEQETEQTATSSEADAGTSNNTTSTTPTTTKETTTTSAKQTTRNPRKTTKRNIETTTTSEAPTTTAEFEYPSAGRCSYSAIYQTTFRGTKMLKELYVKSPAECFAACYALHCRSANLINGDGQMKTCELFKDSLIDYRRPDVLGYDGSAVYFDGIQCNGE